MMIQKNVKSSPAMKEQQSTVRDAVERLYPGQTGATEVKGPQKKTLDKDDFLKLMMTQLQYQDPFKPSKPEEMATELAQFTNVEQLTAINRGIQGMNQKQSPNLQFQSVGFIGKYVHVDNSKVDIEAGKTASLSFNLPEDATKARVLVKDGEGNLVREILQEDLPKGDHTFNWDGLDRYSKQVQAGRYKVEVVAEGDRGKALDVKLSKVGKVTGVSFEGKEPILLVDGRHVPFKEIVRVEADKPVGNLNHAAQNAMPVNPQSVAGAPQVGEAMDGGPLAKQRPRVE